MARIAPFRGLRFDLARCGEAKGLLAPPYDVIDEEERRGLERNPHNVVHLDLPRGQGEERYRDAARHLEGWIADGSLRFEERPVLYRYRQDFACRGRTCSRQGFIALLQLEPFSAGVVLPHERTLSGPKVDRLNLMRATGAEFSQVFMLYRDPAGEAEAALAGEGPSEVDATTPDGCRHRLWVIDDPVAHERVVAVLAGKQVMIADGHHRYETMLALRDEVRPPGRPPGESLADWGTVFFARAEDPGLIILPTHRLVSGLPADALEAIPELARPWFQVTVAPADDAETIERRLGKAVRVTFAFRRAGSAETVWLELRPEVDLSSLGPPVLRGLDVTVLHGLILGPLLGIDAEALAQQSNLAYTHDAHQTMERISSGAAQAAFLLRPTAVGDVLAACEAGFVLPQKSTYFHPKLASGLVMHRIDPRARP
jgi:uncharacterized protein (DUF1015 family)